MHPTDNDTDESEDTRRGFGLYDAQADRRAHYPEVGYALVEIDAISPPGEALATHEVVMTLSSIEMPAATELIDWVVYDADGFAYTHDDLAEPIGDPEDEVEAALEHVTDGNIPDRRIALARIATVGEEHLAACLAAIPYLASSVDDYGFEGRAEVVDLFAEVAKAFPEHMSPAVDVVMDYLSPETEASEYLAVSATRVVKGVADVDPAAVVDATPLLVTLVQDDSSAKFAAMSALHRIAVAYPDAIAPFAPDLLEMIEDGNTAECTGTLSVLGPLVKEYPHVAKRSIPTAIELLDTDAYHLRGNAGGLLAELADEYPYLDNWLVVYGDGTETEYMLEVSGSVHKSPDLGPVETDDEVDGNLVTGTVRTNSDGYRFDGEVEALVVYGSAEIQLNT